ncbi:MAG: SPOR domain-containing protein [Balneolaceae bacterium]
MKINKEELVRLLVDKTGMVEDEIKSQLDQLIQRIVDAAQRGKALEIKEFGLFYFDDNGDLKFDPSSEFSTEINFKYAGMEPIELKAPRDVSLPSEELTDDTETDFDDDPFADLEEDIPREEPAVSRQTEQSEADEPFDILKEDVEPEDPFNLPEDESQEQEEDIPFDLPPEKTDTGDDPFGDLLRDSAAKLSEEGTETEPETKEEKPAAVKKKTSEKVKRAPATAAKSGGNPITMIIVIIMAFVLIAAGYFVFIEFFQESQPQASVTATVTEPDNEETLPGVTPNAEPEEIIEVTESESQSEEEDLSPVEPVYGLTGQVQDAGNDGFSIVVYSYNRESQARNVAANLNREGYRVLVTTRIVRGNPVWRVSLGQFASIRQALEQAEELPEPFNTEHFIQRIQTN